MNYYVIIWSLVSKSLLSGGGGGRGGSLMSGMCHWPGSIFHFQKSRTSPEFGSFSRTGPDFLNITQDPDPFWQSCLKHQKCQMLSWKNDRSNSNFLLKKYVCLVQKTLCVCLSQSLSINCNSNKPILPVRALVFCSLMLAYSCSYLYVKNDSINKIIVFSFRFYYT